MLENRDLAAGGGESQAQLAQAEANLRSTTSAQIPDSVVKAQTDADSAATDRRGRQETARQSRETLPAGRARPQTGGRCAGGLRAGARRACSPPRSICARCNRSASRSRSESAASQVDAARSHLQSSRGASELLADSQPDLRRGGGPPALRRRDGHARHAAAHGDGYLEGGGARQRAAEPGGIREGGTARHASRRWMPARRWKAR